MKLERAMEIMKAESVKCIGEVFRYEYGEFNPTRASHINSLFLDYPVTRETEGTELIKLKDEFGGEGLGTTFWAIAEIKDPETNEIGYLRINAFYSSWDGVNWYDGEMPEMVVPRDKVITEWVKDKTSE